MAGFTHSELYDAFASIGGRSDFWSLPLIRVPREAVAVTIRAIVYFTGRGVKSRPTLDGRGFWLKTC